MERRILSFALVLCILVVLVSGPILAPPVQALVGVDDIVIAAVIAFGAACGLTLTFAGLDSSGATASVGDMIELYLASIGVADIAAWIGSALPTVYYGLLQLPSALVVLIKDFWDWAVENYSVVDDSVKTISSGIDGTLPPYSRSGTYEITSLIDIYTLLDYVAAQLGRRVSWSTTARNSFEECLERAVSEYNTGGTIYMVYEYPGSFTGFYIFLYPESLGVGDTYKLSDKKINMYFIRMEATSYDNVTMYVKNPYISSGGQYSSMYPIVGCTSSSLSCYASNVNGTLVHTSTSISSTTISLPTDIPADHDAYIDVGAAQTADLDTVTSLVVDDALVGQLVPTMELAETAPVVPEPSPEVSLPPLPVIPDDTLFSRFPFSIPQDVYLLATALVAEPVAPRFELDLSGWGLEGETLVIDLSEWDTVARVARATELIVVAIGLALATRRIYLRG